jgi:hypothetical protein
MVQKELEAQRELVDYGGSFQPNAPPPCKFGGISETVLLLCLNQHGMFAGISEIVLLLSILLVMSSYCCIAFFRWSNLSILS